MALDSKSTVSSHIGNWSVVDEASVDVSFLPQQHRRRLSATTKLALTAYYRCNLELTACRTVFASRYGEYARTFGILKAVASGEPASPAAFSVSVHNAPSGILGIATANAEPSCTLAANQSTIEAGFLESAMQRAELGDNRDLIFIYVDEPLPELYRTFRGSDQTAYAFALRLTGNGSKRLSLSWAAAADPHPPVYGIPGVGVAIASLLERGHGRHSTIDERLRWEWRVE